MSVETYMVLVDPVQSTLGMHEGDPMVRSRITDNKGEYTHSAAERRDSPHELRGDRGENVFVEFVFDDDQPVSLVSVNSYHGTQYASRVRDWSRTDSRAVTVRTGGYGCLGPELGKRWSFMHAVASRCGGGRPTPTSQYITHP